MYHVELYVILLKSLPKSLRIESLYKSYFDIGLPDPAAVLLSYCLLLLTYCVTRIGYHINN